MSDEQHYSSANFSETQPNFKVNLPERLIHQQVEENGLHLGFSYDRKHPVHIVDLPTNSISMTVGELLPNGVSNNHRHSYETIVYILDGHGYSIIEDKKILWKTGDAIYIPNWAWHQHINTDGDNSARYLACENAPMLQTLGQLAIRQEA